jgi:hypothetical protein
MYLIYTPIYTYTNIYYIFMFTQSCMSMNVDPVGIQTERATRLGHLGRHVQMKPDPPLHE